MSNFIPGEDVMVSFKNWQHEFQRALLRQPNVPKDARVIEAARIVASTNPYIESNLSMIERGEAFGPAFEEFLTKVENVESKFPFLNLDFSTRDYIALYISLHDTAFATRHAQARGKVVPSVHERDADCIAYLKGHELAFTHD